MSEIIRGRHLWIPKGIIPNGAGLKASLTFDTFTACEEMNGCYVVPRYFVWGNSLGEHPIREGARPSFEPLGGRVLLRSLPRGIQHLAVQALLDEPSGIISLSPGQGKTVVAIHAWVHTDMPLLVVCHTQDLFLQWGERLQQHTSLSPQDIGWVQGSDWVWEGKLVVVAMLQTLANAVDDLPAGFADRWGVVVFDECHHLAAPTFQKVATLGAGKRWGLSATPERRDGMGKLIEYHLGPVIFKSAVTDLVPITTFFRTGLELTDDQQCQVYTQDGGLRYDVLLTLMGEVHEKRVKKLLRKLAHAGRTVLVLGPYLAELRALYKLFENVGFLSGDVPLENRAEQLHGYPMVFASLTLAKEALDRPEIDTIVLLYPIGDFNAFRQIIGRAQRTLPNKKRPEVYVIEDGEALFARHANVLRKGLLAIGYPYETKVLR